VVSLWRLKLKQGGGGGGGRRRRRRRRRRSRRRRRGCKERNYLMFVGKCIILIVE
jgi:hypothetical protein